MKRRGISLLVKATKRRNKVNCRFVLNAEFRVRTRLVGYPVGYCTQYEIYQDTIHALDSCRSTCNNNLAHAIFNLISLMQQHQVDCNPNSNWLNYRGNKSNRFLDSRFSSHYLYAHIPRNNTRNYKRTKLDFDKLDIQLCISINRQLL